ncbi:MAG: hypothetical protein GF331_11010 [Chitinivibrionales bacterium]|nr:hypothetical protein [Chitinivibrionales bacterium]
MGGSNYRTCVRWLSGGLFCTCAVLLLGCHGGQGSDEDDWELLFTESFDYENTHEIAAHWIPLTSPDWQSVSVEAPGEDAGWRIEDSALYGYGHKGFHNLTFRDTLLGDMRVEWDATPLRRNLNLNCYIASANRRTGYTFHVAGYDDPSLAVLTKGASIAPLDNRRLPSAIEVGRTYHLRMEKVGQRVRLYIDGKQLFNYRDFDDLSGPGHQTFGFENCAENRLRIDNVRVWIRRQSTVPSPLAQANEIYQKADYAAALRQYRRISANAAADTAAQAMYRAARCLEALDSADAAIRQYEDIERRFAGDEIAALSAGQRAAIFEHRGDTAAAARVYRMMGERYPGHAVLRTVLFNRGNERMARRDELVLRELVLDSNYDGAAGKWLVSQALELQALAESFGLPVYGNAFIDELINDAREKSALTVPQIEELFPGNHECVAAQYNDADGHHIVAERFKDVKSEYTAALRSLGENRKAVSVGGDRRVVAEALLELGRYDDVLRRFPDQRNTCASAMYRSGQFERLFTEYGDMTDTCMKVAGTLGRTAELFRTMGPDYYSIATALFYYLHKPKVALLVLEGAQVSYTFRDYLIMNDALRAMGRFMEAGRRFGHIPKMEMALGDNYMAMGRPDLTVRMYPRVRELCALALMHQGRLDSVIAEFPDQ